MKFVLKTGMLILFVTFLSGCWSLPEGIAPHEEIIPVPEKVDVVENQESAVNHMLLYLITECNQVVKGVKPIQMATVFHKSGEQFDDMPKMLWKKLIGMRTVWEVKKKSLLIPTYQLYSKIVKTKAKNVFAWNVKLLSPTGKKVFWKKTLYFKSNKEE